jgi:hypothetical protein
VPYDQRFCPDCRQPSPLDATRCACGSSFEKDSSPILIQPDSPYAALAVNAAACLLGGLLIGAYAATYYMWPPFGQRGSHRLQQNLVESDTKGQMTVRFVIGTAVGFAAGMWFIKIYVNRR